MRQKNGSKHQTLRRHPNIRRYHYRLSSPATWRLGLGAAHTHNHRNNNLTTCSDITTLKRHRSYTLKNKRSRTHSRTHSVYISNVSCTVFMPLTAITVFITFSKYVVNSRFKCNNLLTGSTKTHKTLKMLLQAKKTSIPFI